MYLIPLVVPIFLDGDRMLVATDWKRALFLLRDSLGGKYGELTVAGPWLAADSPRGRQQQLETIAPAEGVRLEPVFPIELRARHFWMRELRGIRAKLRELVERAQVVHSGVDDLRRPMMEMALGMAFRRGTPTVFVLDTDTVEQIPALAGSGLRDRLHARIYCAAYERVARRVAARADLSLLKGKSLMRRYAPHALNAHEFHNTSYLASEVVAARTVETRLAARARPDAPLRFVYCGRLVARKGTEDSIRIIAAARRRGCELSLDLIGSGPQEEALRALAVEQGVADAIRFLGSRAYGVELLRELATYDALLFTPIAEDTPRMIFDGYAAGLPLVGAEIPYVRERADEEGAAVVFPRGDLEAGVAAVVGLARDPERLAALTRNALAAGHAHAADTWYARRAEWTHEAVARKLRSNGRAS